MTTETEEDTTVELIRASPESRTWAAHLMDGVRAVQTLHHPKEFQTEEDGDVVGCVECSRIAGELVENWPCDTAVALGIQDGPLL